MVAKDMDILKVRVGSVLELDTKEVADVRRRSTTKLNSNSRGIVSYVPGLVFELGTQ